MGPAGDAGSMAKLGGSSPSTHGPCPATRLIPAQPGRGCIARRQDVLDPTPWRPGPGLITHGHGRTLHAPAVGAYWAVAAAKACCAAAAASDRAHSHGTTGPGA